mmetsp:Transcript_75028/g.132908  ORF Transcript_75028/g.132908 Transcript_75028/m.132908 type:complete len:239 (+) Transcript_75028:76-792(+)
MELLNVPKRKGRVKPRAPYLLPGASSIASSRASARGSRASAAGPEDAYGKRVPIVGILPCAAQMSLSAVVDPGTVFAAVHSNALATTWGASARKWAKLDTVKEQSPAYPSGASGINILPSAGPEQSGLHFGNGQATTKLLPPGALARPNKELQDLPADERFRSTYNRSYNKSAPPKRSSARSGSQRSARREKPQSLAAPKDQLGRGTPRSLGNHQYTSDLGKPIPLQHVSTLVAGLSV